MNRLIEPDAVAHFADELQPLQDLLLRLGPEALELRHPPRFVGESQFVELVERVDLERLVDRLDLLRPQAGDAQHLDQPGGDLRLELVVERQAARRGVNCVNMYFPIDTADY